MKHLHTLGIAFGFKTATTCCGRRVKFTDLALTEDADCTACRAKADQDHAMMLQMLESLEAQNDLDMIRSEHFAILREHADQGPRYRNALLGVFK